MIIATNKRTYHFDIRSGEYDGRSDEELVYTVRFFYPQANQITPLPPKLLVPNRLYQPNSSQNSSKKTSENDTNLVPSANQNNIVNSQFNAQQPKKLNFNFSFSGNDQSITPVKVFDDGAQTMIQFINNNKDVPEISVVNWDGSETKVNYIIKNGTVIVPAVAKQITLRLNQAIVCIFNNNIITN